MRKIFTAAIVAATMLFATSSVQAQVKFGLKGGLNVTNMSLNSEVFDADNQTGFFIGPTVKFTLPIVGLGIDASALYDQRDAKITVEDNGASVESKIKNQSINIPINLRYGVGLGSTASVYLFAGPQFGFNVGDKNVDLGGDSNWKFRSSQFSVNVGAGFSFMNHFEVTANYNIACGKTGDATLSKTVSEVVGSATKDKGRANAWQIALAYYF